MEEITGIGGVRVVAIYARVSTDEQADRETIESQLTACRDYCRHNGWGVAAEYRDESVSGAKPLDERLEGKRLLEHAEEKIRPFDSVVVYRLDRLARNTVQCLMAIQRLERLGVRVESVNETFDDTPSGHFALTVMSAVAQLERDLIRERTSTGRKRRVLNGKYKCSQAPFGYIYQTCGQRKCGHPECGLLYLHPEQAEIVRLMFRWATEENIGLKAIATRLDEMKIPPPSPKHPRRQSQWGWHFSTVHKILTNTRYIGENTYAGIPMHCPPLVDEETFGRTQTALRGRQRNSLRNTRYTYLLQHLVYCRACGSRYAVQSVGREGSSKRAVYCCRQRRVYGPKADATHKGIKWRWSGDELEGIVKRAVKQVLIDPSYYLPTLEVEVERIKHEVASAPARVEDLKAKVNELDGQEAKVLDWAQRGIIDDNAMLVRLDGIGAERRGLLAELESAQQEAAEAVDIAEGAELFLAIARGATPSADVFIDEVTGGPAEPTPEVWRECIQEIAEKVWIEPDGVVTIEGPGGVTVSNLYQ